MAETGRETGKPRAARSAAWVALVPPALVFAAGLGIGIAWETQGAFAKALRALLFSAAGPLSFLVDAGLLVRSLVVVGIAAVYLGLARVTPLGRARWHKLLLWSAVWCALGLVALVLRA